ncbi:extradiol dioxygenase [Nocardia vulneris]|uniref:Extradiol dioxygenase n=1 Tax=Nocardia vulneris TaxID=1141657 RepID=A0ABR4ZJR2_9NOCA|nr:extradiol dioxygenase [Nocardia vulneris]
MRHDGGVEVRGIDNVLVPVGDLAAAVEFYGGRLGLSVRFTVPERGIALFGVAAQTPGIMAQLDPAAGRGTAPAMRVWLEVPDARAAAAELEGHGVDMRTAPFEVATGWSVELADPWGNVIGLTDYLKRPDLARPTP